MKASRGLSLLEVQLAMMLLLVAVLTALAVTPTGMHGVQQAQGRTFVTSYARHVLESTLALPFNQQQSVGSTPLETIIPGIPSGIYTYTITVQAVAQNTEIHSIEATILWWELTRQQIPVNSTDPGTKLQKNVRLVTYSAKL